MNREEFEMLTEDQKFQLVNEIESLKESNKEIYNSGMSRTVYCKCKPTYEFQSIEFDWDFDLDDEESQSQMFETYLTFLGFLQAYAPKQSKETHHEKKEKPQKFATQAQLEYMDRLGIIYPNPCSIEVAKKLISEKVGGRNA